MNGNRLLAQSRRNCLLLSPISLKKKRKTGANFLDANLIWVAPSAGMQVRLLVCIMKLLAEGHTFERDKGVYEKRC
jgi:hypothetical protein